MAEALFIALLLTLDRLPPLERASFLLHDVFDFSFAEVATTLDPSEAAWRKLATTHASNLGAWAFWLRIESEPEITIASPRRHLEYRLATVSVILFVLVTWREFRFDSLVWLVMPFSYAWCAYQYRRGLRPS